MNSVLWVFSLFYSHSRKSVRGAIITTRMYFQLIPTFNKVPSANKAWMVFFLVIVSPKALCVDLGKDGCVTGTMGNGSICYAKHLCLHDLLKPHLVVCYFYLVMSNCWAFKVLWVEAFDNTKFIMSSADHQRPLAHVLWACVYSVVELLAARHFYKWFARKCIIGSKPRCPCCDSSVQLCNRLHTVFLSASETWSTVELYGHKEQLANLRALGRVFFL